MSRHSQLKLAMPSVHGAPAAAPGSPVNAKARSVKLGLGVNQRTGRVQWCPGLTCCKLLLLLPVVMLPLTLVLILIMRLDGMLAALQLNEQRMRNLQNSPTEVPSYMEDYESLLPEGSTYNNLINEEFILPAGKRTQLQILAAERARRCQPYRYGNGESMELEERNTLMKDSRTSFLPLGIPRECLGSGIDLDIKPLDEELYQRQKKRYQDIAPYWLEMIKTRERREAERQAEETSAEISEATAALQSFWNEEGTREGIRMTQAKTMKRYMDNKVDPCVDFYKYACGNWERLHPIPKDKAGFDTFEMLRESLDLVLRNLLEKNTPVHPAAEPRKSPVRNTLFKLNEQGEGEGEADQPAALTAERLRRHIVSKRQLLNRVLVRYKRYTNGTKRKRLIETPREKTKEEEAAPPGVLPKDRAKDKPDTEEQLHVPTDFLKPQHDAQLKAKNLYRSCVNSAVLAKRGLEPLHTLIRELGGWPVLESQWSDSHFNWQVLAATLRRYNNDILIVQWVGADIKNSEENIVQFDQTGLGLPTREYFLQPSNAKYLQAYQRYMAEVMHKMGASKADAQRVASELVAFETQLAGITAPAEQRLNVTKLYKRMTLDQLEAVVPEIKWRAYLQSLQDREVLGSEEVVIYAVEYMSKLVTLMEETDTRTVANYMMWRFVRHRINNVDDRFDDIKQSFYHALFGREESPQRWKVCIAQVNTNMGMAVGSMFVSRYFDNNSKRDTLRMTHDLQQAFRDILKTTDWLDSTTKQLAEEKVNAMSLKIGYPDFILNPGELNSKYAGIEIHPEKYFENTLNVLLHTAKTEQAKLHERVNKTNWQTAPAIVNAYYSRNKNQIMFPAGILQPPFYHRHFPKSLNFGGIGVVIGHELTHGFDDKGRLFDRNGNIHKWWTDSSIRGFDERARCIIAQYSNYTVEEVGIVLNGESTQGENIADNGGLRQAFHAYQRWLKEHPREVTDEILPGLNMTGPQLFFLNFGQVWCGAMRPEAIRNKLNTAIHSPGRFRVIGTLSNSVDFAREFNCPLGSPMNPHKKCSVW
ncbi:neprilysin-4 isoform X1 [Drosophila santomea]|uniref:neprilysin-4 isoform X1 n=1 Tax=Drosophila santomea TaxID=129105 RepID=UPI001952B82B|nr:neprilysin-4 isoform X1 [Drosophila santomea]XP_039493006.1 neprilysin-4 isoform X1 [Drosophila santomea]